jgi:DNA-binding CsgD family transcriptional regulator/GAF domain-containing protein
MDATVTRPAPTRRRDDGRQWSGRACRVNAAHVGEIDELVGAAGRLLDRDLRRADSVIADHSSARAVLGIVWDAAVDALLAGDHGAAVAARGSGLVELMNAVRDLDTRLLHEQVRLRDRAFDRVRDSLAALREADTTAALVDLAPATACTLGFDRAIVSRIADSLWIPEKVHVERDAKWADEILEIGRAQPQVLGGALVETEMVRRRVAILVDQVQDRPGVHRPIAEASMSRSYTAAPIVVGGEVAGFVHADCYHQQRDVDETDRLALAMFAEGLGQALSRTMVLDRLDALRSEIDCIARTVTAARDCGPGTSWRPGAAETTTDPRRMATGATDQFLQSVPVDSSLTRREVEVLRLMAAGDTNARIARRLVISEGTVKSHVKHILRKLGAANRAEAVSHWLRMGYERRPGAGEGIR